MERLEQVFSQAPVAIAVLRGPEYIIELAEILSTEGCCTEETSSADAFQTSFQSQIPEDLGCHLPCQRDRRSRCPRRVLRAI